MTDRIIRSIAGALVALLAAVGLGAATAGAAVAAPRSVAAAAATPGTSAEGAFGASTGQEVRTEARAGSTADSVHLAAKDEKKKKGFFAKLGKFLLVVIILIILFFVLLIVGIVYAVKRIFSRRK
ncbi:hypothetical protein [Kitasatospora brasiliensis]|uniref:hypothetical protein n=1 Tax=Kitasatospora brasiliensis TaxID=3058040 RepID=UPI00292F44DD|nr:hypothetical protein [Kitasatospora sp. K002]